MTTGMKLVTTGIAALLGLIVVIMIATSLDADRRREECQLAGGDRLIESSKTLTETGVDDGATSTDCG